jgi:hypothetical protein
MGAFFLEPVINFEGCRKRENAENPGKTRIMDVLGSGSTYDFDLCSGHSRRVMPISLGLRPQS